MTKLHRADDGKRDVVECNICKKTFNQCAGSTTNLQKHLNLNHAKQWKEILHPPEKTDSTGHKVKHATKTSLATLSKLHSFRSAEADEDGSTSEVTTGPKRNTKGE